MIKKMTRNRKPRESQMLLPKQRKTTMSKLKNPKMLRKVRKGKRIRNLRRLLQPNLAP